MDKRKVEVADILLIIGTAAIIFVILRFALWLLLGLLRIDIVTVLIILTIGLAFLVAGEFLTDKKKKAEKKEKKIAPLKESSEEQGMPEAQTGTEPSKPAAPEKKEEITISVPEEILEEKQEDVPKEAEEADVNVIEERIDMRENVADFDPERAKMLIIISDWSDWDKNIDDPIKAKTACIKLKKYLEEKLADKDYFKYGADQTLKVSNQKNISKCLDRLYKPDPKSESNLNGAMYELYEIARNKNNRSLPVTEKEMQLLLVLCVSILGFIDARYPVAANVK